MQKSTFLDIETALNKDPGDQKLSGLLINSKKIGISFLLYTIDRIDQSRF